MGIPENEYYKFTAQSAGNDELFENFIKTNIGISGDEYAKFVKRSLNK